LTIKLGGDIAALLEQQARKQGTSGARLAAALLETIARDNLYDAVTDQCGVGRRRTKEIGSGLDPSSRTEVLGSPAAARRPRLVESG
jgi:hypothetical protein